MRSREGTRASISAGIILGKKKTGIYLYTWTNCSSRCRYQSQGNPFHSILALDQSMCEYVSCVLFHTSHCTVAMTTTDSSYHSLMITRICALKKVYEPLELTVYGVLYKTTPRFTTERLMAFNYYSNPMNWRNQESHRVGASYQFTYNFFRTKGTLNQLAESLEANINKTNNIINIIRNISIISELNKDFPAL